ncbi:MAG: RNA 2',3'-cyclic phosphodiesterase [Coriobacteriia bacterium]|nr:RNA 2',3'-cyclic phosphodiesterase [Coriobacteriia bacterium]
MYLRTFIGIALPVVTRQTVRSAQQAMQASTPEWRDEKWVAEENLHITVKFLGQVPEGLMTQVDETLITAASTMRSFQVRIGDISAVPRPRSATMLWTGIEEGSAATIELANTVDAALVEMGFPAETRSFKPHITLVRSRNPQRVPFEMLDVGQHVFFAAEDRLKRMSVRGVTLYTSTLTPQGPVYEERLFAPLAD